ncbi:MAG: fimbrillin family protein [Bacteroidaceae bacterium]|nr:fimbrillin family protein [Bacteroidaceae bacterium]
MAKLFIFQLFILSFFHSFISSCSSEQQQEQEQPQQQEPIGFRADMAENGGIPGTRAAGDGEHLLDNAALKAKGFGVYCWYTKGRDVLFTDSKGTTPAAHISTYTGEDGYMLMRNQKVEWDGSKWDYTPSKYWPMDPNEKLTFRAYAPYTNYLMTDAATGFPLLPVVVDKDDYHNGTQHDPLWGTGRLIQGDTDPTPGEYFPKPEPDDANPEKTYLRYGHHYNNITYKMSGDWRDIPVAHSPKDNRDGVIDWFFHHGMAKLVFWGLLNDKSDSPSVTAKITSITLTPLYSQGLLDISSPTASNAEKPYWYDRAEDMTVTLLGYDYNSDPKKERDLTTSSIGKYNEELANNGWTQLTEKGLLIIPRDYSMSPMTLTVSFRRDDSPENEITMSTTITQEFLGNTIYSLRLNVSNALYVEIDVVKSAFIPWTELSAEHEVYNW